MSTLTTFDAVIDFAIREEEKAHALYSDLATKIDRDHLKRLERALRKRRCSACYMRGDGRAASCHDAGFRTRQWHVQMGVRYAWGSCAPPCYRILPPAQKR